MKLLLDECIPRRFKHHFAAHDCQTVPETGLAGKKNGQLLIAAEQAGFEAFITVDKSIPDQQDFSRRKIALLVLRARSNELEDLLPHVPACLRALRSIKRGQIVRVGNPES